VTDLKDRLIEENSDITWLPDHIKEGRFGNWLAGARDWAISRTRFWGAPLPVWRCEECREVKVIGSLAELQASVAPAKNKYWIMRHGQATSNLESRISYENEKADGLTEEGKKEVKISAFNLASAGIDMIVSSPFRRTKETAAIIAQELNVPVEERDGLKEINVGSLEGQSWLEYEKLFPSIEDKLDKAPEGGESVTAVRARVMSTLFQLEEKYTGKNILIVSHGLPLRALVFSVAGVDDRSLRKSGWKGTEMGNAEVRFLDFKPYPHNNNFDLDYHRPYSDEITFSCSCGGVMKRVPDVFDCWFESGAMPYGQIHYPFGESKSICDPEQNFGFPADFIAEGQDQTRGWFYTLLILGTALFDQSPYKNVVVNGLILAEDGQKMSKRLKNYPDPMLVANKYGADALRLYLLSSPAVHAGDLNFSEKGVGEIYRKVIMRLLNVVTFLETYGRTDLDINIEADSEQVLDRWILSRLAELISKVGRELDGYELDRAIWAIDDFIDDLSNWYLRRSRDRFRGEDKKDSFDADRTLRFVLIQLSKVLAPFAPFVADDIYLRLTKHQAKASVHLETWPEVGVVDGALVSQMISVRKIVASGLEFRMSAGIKVRQPLAKISISDESLSSQTDLLNLIKDELNIKEVDFDNQSGESVWLDTVVTPELRQEGSARDLIRLIQERRKKDNFVPSDKASLNIFADEQVKVIVGKYLEEIKRVAGLSQINFSDSKLEVDADGTVEEWPVWLELNKQ
jgi:isoleucyl-tRNA synthetase